MFDRVAYKKAAKAQLKGRWKIPVLTTLLIFALASIFYGALQYGFSDGFDAGVKAGDGRFNFYFNNSVADSSLYSVLYWCVTLAIAAFALAQLHCHMILSAESRDITFSDFVDGLNQWWQAVRGYLWLCLWLFLWALLFFIPALIKYYSYSMMFYVMAENPKIGVMKAMNISKELTRGYKAELFVTDLSFIPWIFLCMISCGVGLLWFVPYYSMTRTNVYFALKQVALDTKRIKIEDFQ